MPDFPRVSIITPSYNHGRFIRETINSVLSQDYPHLEYIIVDGGSTDETLDILHSLNDPRIHWISEPDGGISDALNKGFGRATGEVMGWLNSDDRFEGQVIAPSMAYFAAHPTVDLIYGDLAFMDEQSQPLTLWLRGRPFDPATTLSDRTSIPQPGTMWRRRLWEKTGRLRHDLAYTMDTDYWLRAARYGQFTYLPGIRASFRVHSGSKTTRDRWETWQECHGLAEAYQGMTARRRLVHSNLAYHRAQMQRERGEDAREAARRALWYSPLRPRWLYLLALVLDTHLGWETAETLRRGWLKIKGDRPL